MAAQDKIALMYGDGIKEDSRANWSRNNGLEFHYTKKALADYITPGSRVLEIGCATGYCAMHFADKCRQYVGVDVHPPHIEIFSKKIVEKGLANVSCQVGDALKIENISDAAFDVVLCLGPMYHLSEEEREIAMAKCCRVCKPGGIVAIAYINKIGAYAGACVIDSLRENYPNKLANDYCLKKGMSDTTPGLFYFTTPEDMEKAAARHGLTKLRNMGTDFFFCMNVVDQMDDEKFALFMEIADEMVSHESCTGMSNHALLICRK